MLACGNKDCTRRFCEHCLSKSIGDDVNPATSDAWASGDWSCPVCRNLCCCSGSECNKNHRHCKAYRYRRRRAEKASKRPKEVSGDASEETDPGSNTGTPLASLAPSTHAAGSANGNSHRGGGAGGVTCLVAPGEEEFVKAPVPEEEERWDNGAGKEVAAPVIAAAVVPTQEDVRVKKEEEADVLVNRMTPPPPPFETPPIPSTPLRKAGVMQPVNRGVVAVNGFPEMQASQALAPVAKGISSKDEADPPVKTEGVVGAVVERKEGGKRMGRTDSHNDSECFRSKQQSHSCLKSTYIHHPQFHVPIIVVSSQLFLRGNIFTRMHCGLGWAVAAASTVLHRASNHPT